MNKKDRLDILLNELYPDYSRRQIQGWIMRGKARIDNEVNTKPGTMVRRGTPISLHVEVPKFVSRAGFKIEKALDHFKVDVTDLVVMDSGQSTGGFSDCLLQRGASKIYGVDVGHGQLHEKIREHERVVVMERTNLRHLESLPELVDLVTLDLSFISVIKVMDAVLRVLKPGGKLLVLVKPQFEAPRGSVNSKGVIKDPKLRDLVVQAVIQGIQEFGLEFHGFVESPIFGAQGNTEYIAYFTNTQGAVESE
jgi:23S rRNA (cytidine1920-2'-O)/16S rRNA (cytidine1409-2'-O)-methyltransferase